jgi:hypothetical protein
MNPDGSATGRCLANALGVSAQALLQTIPVPAAPITYEWKKKQQNQIQPSSQGAIEQMQQSFQEPPYILNCTEQKAVYLTRIALIRQP